MRPDLRFTSLALLIMVGFGPSAFAAQDPEPQEGPIPVELPRMMDETQQEILQLFRDIEQNLRKVDLLLSDAGAGDTARLAEVEEAGIGRLLEDSRERSQQVLEDIDRLLDIAQQMGQQSGSGGAPRPPRPAPTRRVFRLPGPRFPGPWLPDDAPRTDSGGPRRGARRRGPPAGRATGR